MNRKYKLLKAVSLVSFQRAAEMAYNNKRGFCQRMAQENGSCWSELHPFEVLRDIANAMTPAGFKMLKDNIYPDNPSNANELTLEQRQRHGIGAVDSDFED